MKNLFLCLIMILVYKINCIYAQYTQLNVIAKKYCLDTAFIYIDTLKIESLKSLSDNDEENYRIQLGKVGKNAVVCLHLNFLNSQNRDIEINTARSTAGCNTIFLNKENKKSMIIKAQQSASFVIYDKCNSQPNFMKSVIIIIDNKKYYVVYSGIRE